MLFYDSKGKEVVDVDLELRHVDSFFSYGVYKESGDVVSDEELDYLTEKYQDYIVTRNIEHFGYWQD